MSIPRFLDRSFRSWRIVVRLGSIFLPLRAANRELNLEGILNLLVQVYGLLA
jgi:hypothetical protein